MKKGISNIKITDVAERIDPTSVHIKFKGTVIEQNYQYDLVSLTKILEKYIDNDITLMSDKNIIKGKLLSTGNIVLRKEDGSLLMLPKIDDYQIAVGALPEGLITKPTLVWTLESDVSGKQDVEITYQTSGLNWHTEYVALLNDNDTKMDLKAWVSINNNTGATYKDAHLKLVAGDINRVQRYIPEAVMTKADSYGGAEREEQFKEKSFFEYHIYNLQRPTTIADNETKQISLFDVNDIKVTKKYIYRSGNYYNNSKVAVMVEFENKKENNLGIPMPQGKARLYKSDGESVEFIGEDMIDHTPKDEKIKLKVGDAFDIVVEDVEKDYKSISDKIHEHLYEIKIKNRKTENIVVEVERYLGYNWEILESSLDYEKKDAQNIIFKVPVEKEKEKVLTFKIRYKDRTSD
ncbi:MAG: DUF4139 domain-containing protein [Bacteroidetes bacterium]|nr:DUF4139 domain-containing protein [Bacteroidota bacterium]